MNRTLLVIVSLILKAVIAEAELLPDENPTSSKEWTTKFSEAFTSDFCAFNGPVVSCHKVSRDKCKEDVKIELKKCVEKERLPARFDNLDSYVRHGDSVGACVGGELETRYERLDLHECTIRGDEEE